jgi:hypothetical protein
MKKNYEKIGLAVLTICCLLLQKQNAVAQVSGSSEFHQIQSNAELKAQIMLSNTEANVEYRLRHPTAEELEAKSNALSHLPPPTYWLETSRKQEILKHCAEILRSDIDTNQIAEACNKLTNQPEAVFALRYVTKVAISNLDEIAAFLTNPNLNDYVGQIGYQAEVSTVTNNSYFIFWTRKGPVRDFHERTAKGDILVLARFYENGKLRYLEIKSPDSKGIVRTGIVLGFNENGILNLHWMRPADKRP